MPKKTVKKPPPAGQSLAEQMRKETAKVQRERERQSKIASERNRLHHSKRQVELEKEARRLFPEWLEQIKKAAQDGCVTTVINLSHWKSDKDAAREFRAHAAKILAEHGFGLSFVEVETQSEAGYTDVGLEVSWRA